MSLPKGDKRERGREGDRKTLEAIEIYCLSPVVKIISLTPDVGVELVP